MSLHVTITPTVCPTRISKVVVHGNGALITRRGQVPGGSREIVVEGLPLLFASDTLRVRPLRPEGGCVVGVVDEVCRVGVTDAPPIAGETALLDARLAFANNDQKRKVMKTLLDHVDASVELPPADVEGLPDTAALLRLSSDNAKRRRQLVVEIRVLDEQRRELKRAEERCAEQMRPDQTPPRVLRGLRVVVNAPTEAEIEIEYFVPAARWVPSYSLHLTSTEQGTQARLVLGALVAQATGEDWDDVELLVSTADLRRETTLPILHSWRLGRAQAERVKGFRPLPSDLPGLFSGWDRFPAHPTKGTRARTVAAPPPPPALKGGGFQTASEDELLSFEEERTGTTDSDYPSGAWAADALDDSDGSDGSQMPGRESDAQPPKSPRAKQTMLTSAPRSPTTSRLMSEGAGAPRNSPMVMPEPPGGKRAGAAAPPVVVDELPPRLRTSAMRMSAADEGHLRGLLLPLDPMRRLEWLLDAADVGDGTVAASTAELRRAVAALKGARDRLLTRALPRGTARVVGAAATVFGGSSSRARSSIPGDGNDHRIEVHEEEGDALILHLGVPRESLDIWRACRFSTKGPLPAGPVQVYEDGAFVVAGRVDGGGGGKHLTLNLGVDPDVRIKARTPHTQQSEKGLMGGTTHIEHKVQVEVRSSRAVPVHLSLFERLPVTDTGEKDIVVSALVSKPPAVRTEKGPRDEELKGGLRFDLTLMPGDVTVVEHSYTITLPAKSELVGGNRRE